MANTTNSGWRNMAAKFPGKCVTCGARTYAGDAIQWQKGVGVRHASASECAAAARREERNNWASTRPGTPYEVKADERPTTNVAGIVEFLKAAGERGLKSPVLRVLSTDGVEMKLKLTRTGRVPGSVSVYVANEYVGVIRPTGEVYGRRIDVDAIAKVAADAEGEAKRFGKLTGNCCFCGAHLSDDRTGSSVEVGYGPTCAKRWGLPHKPRGKAQAQEAVEVKGAREISRAQADVRNLLDAVAAGVARGEVEVETIMVNGEEVSYLVDVDDETDQYNREMAEEIRREKHVAAARGLFGW